MKTEQKEHKENHLKLPTPRLCWPPRRYLLSERYEKTTYMETILGFDLFGSPIPSFNFEGRDKIGSVMGLCLTLVYLFVLISFTFFKTYRFYSGSNPNISASVTVNGWTKDDRIDLLEEKMMGAFAFSDFYKGHFVFTYLTISSTFPNPKYSRHVINLSSSN